MKAWQRVSEALIDFIYLQMESMKHFIGILESEILMLRTEFDIFKGSIK